MWYNMDMVPPIENFSLRNNISQLFGCGADFYKREFGLPAHNGLDITIVDNKNGYGSPILAAHDGIVEKIVQDVPYATKGNGVYLLSEDGTFSTIYWHLS